MSNPTSQGIVAHCNASTIKVMQEWKAGRRIPCQPAAQYHGGQRSHATTIAQQSGHHQNVMGALLAVVVAGAAAAMRRGGVPACAMAVTEGVGGRMSGSGHARRGSHANSGRQNTKWRPVYRGIGRTGR